jgi:hypothetical protein
MVIIPVINVYPGANSYRFDQGGNNAGHPRIGDELSQEVPTGFAQTAASRLAFGEQV